MVQSTPIAYLTVCWCARWAESYSCVTIAMLWSCQWDEFWSFVAVEKCFLMFSMVPEIVALKSHTPEVNEPTRLGFCIILNVSLGRRKKKGVASIGATPFCEVQAV